MKSTTVLALVTVVLFILGIVAAHAAAQTCQTCDQKINGTAVTLKADKTYSYRCITCALIDSERHPDGAITAKSTTGKTVTLTKKGGKWSASPAGAYVLSTGGHDANCDKKHLVFASSQEFNDYAKKHPEARKVKPIKITDVGAVVEAGRPAMPDKATCPVMKTVFKPTTKNQWTIKDGKTYWFCCDGCKPQFNKS